MEASDWTDLALGEVLTLQRGFDLPKRVRNPGLFPVVSSAGLTGFHDEPRVDPPGVVMGRYGSLGSVYWVDEPFWPLNTALWVKDFKGNDARFLYYLLQTVAVDGSTASAVPGVNRNHLHKARVRVPCIDMQKRVAAVLSTFDELIEINERRIELLEDLARSLYREWFVHFRFPGHENVTLVDSELGAIPRAWDIQRLGAVANLCRPSAKPANEPNAVFEHFSIPAFDAGALPKLEPGREIKSSKYRVDSQAVLLAKINPKIRRVWLVEPDTANAVASTEFLIWVGIGASNYWLWCLFMDNAFRRELIGSAGGTSTSHQRFKPADVSERSVVVPPKPILQAFDALAAPVLDLVSTVRKHSRYLAITRDLLLPRLVSGQLDISDVELGVLTPTETE